MPPLLRLVLCSCSLFCCANLIAQTSNATLPAPEIEKHKQILSCGADEAREALYQRVPERAKRHAEADELLYRRFIGKTPAKPDGPEPIYTLPVVVHIIHDGGPENISDAQVLAAIDHLNDAYGHTGYFAQAGPGVEARVRFCLARRTPEGLATGGITRTKSPLTDMVKETDDIAVKDLVRWDPTRYVNVWVVRSISSLSAGPGVAGYAYFPASHGQPEDGMMCEAAFFGMSPSEDAVLIHEMGHYLGLYHTFEGGCPNADCLLDGDRVCDTPPDMAQQTNCPFNSCSTDADAPAPNPFTGDVDDMTENFMDYSPFTCFYRFTEGQAGRMQATIEMLRFSLLKSNACEDPCVPIVHAGLSGPSSSSPAGSTVTFFNQSVGAASYQWFVDDVLVSTALDLNYTFNTSGDFTVKLIVTNGDVACSDSAALTYTVFCPVLSAFTANPVTAKIGEPVLFASTASGATILNWTINGSAVGSGDTLIHTFSAPGAYTVFLVAGNGFCEEQAFQEIEITAPCLTPGACPEICDNGFDDDSDGYVDCYDSDCHCFTGADCTSTPPNNNFSAQLAWQSSLAHIDPITVPIVANLNPQTDSMPEILVPTNNGNGTGVGTALLIFRGDGSNKLAPDRIYWPSGINYYPCFVPAIGDLDRDGIPELIMVDDLARIRVYRNYTPGATPPMQLWFTSNVPAGNTEHRPLLADFDQDGTPEIYIGNKIFKLNFANPALPTLTKVVDGGNNPIGQFFYGNYVVQSTATVAADMLSVADCNGDPDCAGLELVAGSAIFSVDLDPLDGDGVSIKVVRNLNALAPNYTWLDGYTAVADMDLDGVPDVVVNSGRRSGTNTFRGIYVWNKSGLIQFMPNPGVSQFCGSMPCIANVYDDRKKGFVKDFPEIITASSLSLNCFNLHAAAINVAMPWWWTLSTTDMSGATGSSVFDFNADGLSEIVYRDEDNLRIMYGGPAPFPAGVDAVRNWFKTPMFSGTADEYPVVVDVDNDGQAEIAVTGRVQDANGYFDDGSLRVFESANAPWVPCRAVWNQFNYHIVNIDDDLSVPGLEQKHWAEFPAPGSGKFPLNTYLSQLPLLDKDFQPNYPAPDAIVSLDSIWCGKQQLHLNLKVCNEGSTILPDSTPLQFYRSDPTSTAALTYGPPLYLPQKILVNSCLDWAVQLPVPASGTLFGVINDNGSKPRPFNLATDFPSTGLPECVYPNNLFALNTSFATPVLNLGPDRGLCASSVEVLRAGSSFAQYRWQDGSTDSTFTAPGPGKYWVDAWDICGFKFTDTLVIFLQNLTPLELGPDRFFCPGDSLTLDVPGFSAVSWTPASSVSCADCATLTLRPDASIMLHATGQSGSCIVSDSVQLILQPGPVAELTVTPGICALANGSIAATASGGTAPFQFAWSNMASGGNVGQLAAGTYTLTVTNAEGCTVVRIAELPESTNPEFTGTSLTHVRCFGENNGAIAVTVSGGTLPYLYDWSVSGGGNKIENLVAGSYTLTVTDVDGCTFTGEFELTEPPLLLLPAQVDSTSCAGSTARISLAPEGGTMPYTITWNDTDSSLIRNTLPAGDYAVTATDAHGCRQLQNFQVLPGRSPELINTDIVDVRCFGENNGRITASISDGWPPYLYNWSANGNSNSAENLLAGVYTLSVTDQKGCTWSGAFSVTEPDILTLPAEVDSTDCFATTGAITLDPQGGTLPYTLAWNDANASAVRTNLPPGDYTATLTDARGCTINGAYRIEPGGSPALQDSSLTAVRCFGESNGAIEVSISGGVPPYQYDWSAGGNGNTATNLSAGLYELLVSDKNGCTCFGAFTVPEPQALALLSTVDSTTCKGTTGGISLDLQGGTTPYSVLWNDGNTAVSRSNLPPGDYTAKATDANGCTLQQSFTLVPGDSPVLTASELVPVRCFGESNGRVEVSIGGGWPPYQYAWSIPGNGNTITDLVAGTYSLHLTDAKDCELVAGFTVTQPEDLILQTQSRADTCQRHTGSVDLSATGGTAPYQFAWSGGQNTQDLSMLAAGPWALTLTDAKGCTALQSGTVAAIDILPDFALSGNTITCAEPVVTLSVTPRPFNWSFQWQTPGGGSWSGPVQQTGIPGAYAATVTNEFGCTGSKMLQIAADTLVPKALAAQHELVITCDAYSAVLDGSLSASGPDIVLRWFRLLPDGQLAWDTLVRVASTGLPGLYYLQVTDLSNGCIGTDSVLVGKTPGVDALLARADSVSCYGMADGSIRVDTVLGGTSPFLFSLDNKPFSSIPVFNQLPAGNYTLFVEDVNGCGGQIPLTVGQPGPLQVFLHASDTLITIGQSVELKAMVLPAGTALGGMEWWPPALFSAQDKLVQRVKPDESTLFQIRINDWRGCMATAEIRVDVLQTRLYVPNVFDPARPDNNVFTVFSGSDIRNVRLLRIFDRWGELLFERRDFAPNDPSLGWDGSFRGKHVSPGVYAYFLIVDLPDGQSVEVTGDVTVLR